MVEQRELLILETMAEMEQIRYLVLLQPLAAEVEMVVTVAVLLVEMEVLAAALAELELLQEETLPQDKEMLEVLPVAVAALAEAALAKLDKQKP